MLNMQRVVWEGWTPMNFVQEMEMEIEMIMSGESFIKPFETKKELTKYLKENQPYYKKSIPEVNAYFANKYGLRG